MRCKMLLASLVTAFLLVGTAFQVARAETMLQIHEHAVGRIDPAKATDYADSILFYNLYDTLVIPVPGGTDLEPHLAESWEVDGLTYTFTLRSDVRFLSGNLMDSEDVAFSLERLLALGEGFSHLFAGLIAEIETPDPQTFQVTLTRPHAPFLGSLVRLGIVDKATVLENLSDGDYGEYGDYGEAYLSEVSAGTGAYQIVSHATETLTVMRKAEDYFLGIPPEAPDTVRLHYSIEPATLRSMLAGAELDIGDQWMAPEIKAALARGGNIDLGVEAGISSFYLKLNNQKPPLDDVHCRRAFAYAFDYDAILEQTRITDEISFGQPAHGPLPVGVLGSDESLPTGTFDLDLAREELEQCAYDAGDYNIELNWVAGNPIQERIQLMMQANLRALGFDASISTVPWAMFTELASTPESTPHVSPINFILTTPDPDSMLFTQYHSSAAGSWASADWVLDDEVDGLIEAGRSELDPERREEIYRELGQLLVDNQVSIFAYELLGVFPIRDVVSVPRLEDPANSYAVQGMNLMFREMIME